MFESARGNFFLHKFVSFISFGYISRKTLIMELINFAAWIEQQKVLTSTDVDTTTDQFIIGKKVNDKRDGSQYQAFAINATELAKIFAPPVSTEKVYKALLTKDNLVVEAPVVTVKENSVGAVVWTRQSDGVYVGTLAGAFPAGGRVVARGGITQSINDSQWIIYNVTRLSNNAIILTGYDVINQEAAVDGDFFEVPVEVTVYAS